MSMLHLDRLTLRNFRCFAQCDVELHRQLTVLVAENGRGKTAILDAIGISLGLDTPTFQTRGVESADVLATIMGVDPIPQVEEARWLSRYRAFIEDGQSATLEARALRTKLVNHFGAMHPVILDCDRLLRFQAFKLRRSAGQGEAG